MKNINLIAITVAAILLLASCEDEGKDPRVIPAAWPMITAPAGGSFVLTEEEEENLLLTAEWDDADFGFRAEITYVLELDKEGNEFNDPVALATTSSVSSASLYVGALNNILLSAGYPFGVEGDFEIRVSASVHSDVNKLYSDPVILSFTPFEKIVVYPMLYVPGDYMIPDWSPGDSPNVYSLKSNNRYEGYIYSPNATATYKFTSEPSWSGTNYGYGSGDEVSGTLSDDGGAGNLSLTGAGYYKLNIDLNAMTYNVLRTDWGIIGDATPDGWDNDTDMSYDPVAKVWSITLDLTPGEMKFRANDDWILDYGSNNANGIADQGGKNIPIETAGNYTVELDLNGPLYRYTITRN